ncbi:MAG: GDP-mannose 4,6-dehydratase [Thermoproteota archaeon]
MGNVQSWRDKFEGKRVLVTGGLGFIGSNLSRILCDLGAHVTVIDSMIPEYGGNPFNLAGYESRIKINISDVRDQYGLRYLVRDQDFLFNLAGQVSHTDSMKDPYTDLDINVRAQIFILEACRLFNPDIRIVFASTRQIYGRPQYLPVDEKHPIVPVDVNGINKAAGEWYHLLYGQVYGLKVTSLRLTNTYGPRMRIKDARQTFLGWWIYQVIKGEEIQIYGTGEQIRDLNFVDDVVDAMLRVAIEPKAIGEVYNLGGEPIKLVDLAKLLIESYGCGSFRIVPFPEERKVIDIGNYYGSYEKIKAHLGWEPKVSIKDGLERTLEYYKKFWQHYV